MSVEFKVDDILESFADSKLLDEGGQKVVFTVSDPKWGVCVLKIGYFFSRTSLERIIREVQILSEIHSDFFPKNYDFVVVDTQRYYILEEFIEGSTLDKVIEKYESEAVATKLIVELVKALRILWNSRIVHRDVKPQNIIITENGPKVIDLGIARLLDATSLTNTMAPFGPRTPAYASPEQLENRKRDIDYRSDQFNLGIIFAQLILGGKHPFSPELVGNSDSILENILSGNWAKDMVKERVSSGTFSLIDKLLGHEPYQRFRKIEELQQKLDELSGG